MLDTPTVPIRHQDPLTNLSRAVWLARFRQERTRPIFGATSKTWRNFGNAFLDGAVSKTVSYVLMKTRISSKGQIVLPAELRQQDRIEAGQEFEVERLDRGEYRLVRRTARPNEGVVDWLLACPEKGFFVPIESESTDAL